LSIDQANTQRAADPGEQATMRAQLHGMWGSVAPAWREHADFIDRRGRVTTERLLELAAVRPGDRVLELACGPGGLGLAAARLAGPDGEVVLSDVAEEMTPVALARAHERGLSNVAARVLDIEAIDEPNQAYDVVLCRDGLMFALDPAQAARELHRILRPEGRYAVAVWGPAERNPWLSIVLDSVSRQLDHPVPPPGVPGPFALSDAEKLSSLLRGANLEVSIEELPVPMEAASFEEWWERTCALAGALSRVVAALPAEVLDAVQDRARTASERYVGASGLAFPGLQLLASGQPCR
jgi:ubiquinone/menaquinone biosynthesis C-methylase UbiE